MKNLANNIRGRITDPSCSDDANLQNLIHVFAGYRAIMLNDEELEPYSPGSARQVSFEIGITLANEDKALHTSYDMHKNADFKKYFDTTLNRNFWVLGYFGGGSINISDAYNFALQMASALDVPTDSIRIDEILQSRRYKGFKFIYSMHPDQIPESDISAENTMSNVYEYLTN